jgi:excisionase family DNA binding protein
MGHDATLVREDAYLTPQEAADYLKVSKDTICDACAAGALKASKLGHRTVRFKRQWLDDWAESHCRDGR